VQLTFLGTGGGLPSPSRGVSALAVQIGREIILFDCGEGTQRQFMFSPLSFMRVNNIFITHYHGDHFLGLPGLIQSMNFSGRENELHVYGPEGTIETVTAAATLGAFQPLFDVHAHEMADGDVVDLGPCSVKAISADHTVPALSYILREPDRKGRFNAQRARELGVPEGPMFARLQAGEAVVVGDRRIEPHEVMGPPRSGRRIVYSGDTRPSEALLEASRGANVLVHEATLDSSLEEGALEYGHSTARAAAEMAKAADVDQLILTHISNRYDSVDLLEAEAREIFPNTVLAHDFMSFPVRFSDRPR